MTPLAERKRQLLAEADLHRAVLRLESLRLQGQWEAARAFVPRHRWWFVGGAALAGVLLARQGRGAAGWLPLLTTVWRQFGR